MEYNSSNLTSEFAGAAAPTNAMPNDDLDTALGYGKNPNDDFMTAFGKAFQAGQFRNSEEGRKATAEFAKQKLANQLAEQLQKRKYELAQQYEPYSHFVNLPNGSVIGVGQQGAKELYSDPNAAKLYNAETAAKIVKAGFESSPAHLKALEEEDRVKPLVQQSQIEANQGLAAYRPIAAKAAQAHGEAATNPPIRPTEWTADKELKLRELAIQSLYPGYTKGPMAFTPANKRFDAESKTDPAALEAKIKAKMQELRPAFEQPSGGIANPQSGAQAPDLSGIMQPLNVDN